MTAIRIFVAAIFFAVMAVMYQIAKGVVAMGFVPWLVMMVVIFWVGIKIENHDRALEGRPPYSWYDAGRDVRESLPVLKFSAIVLLAVFLLTRFI